MKKMGDLADSKRNMKIDLRPRVFFRVMRLEALIFLFSCTMCFSLVFYHLKARTYYEDHMEKTEAYNLVAEEKRLIAEEKEE